MNRRACNRQTHDDACHALAVLADALVRASPVASPRQFLCLIGTRAAGIRCGPLALLDLLRGGHDRLPGHGFRREFDDTTRGQVRHFVGTARAVMLFGPRGTAWLSVHVRRDPPNSADGRLGEVAIRFATLLLNGQLAATDAPCWIRSALCTEDRGWTVCREHLGKRGNDDHKTAQRKPKREQN